MNIIGNIIIIIGLIVFEIVNSVNNAIINAYVLKTMSEKWRKIFLFWGILFAVFVVRGILPFLVVWLSAPQVGLANAFTAIFSGDPQVMQAIDAGRPLILIAAGVFLILLYLHWLFLEEKSPLFVPDKLMKPHYGIWFFAFAALILVALLYFARHSPMMMLSAAIGNAVFFIIYGFQEQAQKQEEYLKKNATGLGDLSKLLYLEVLDASFSFDGVLGAFAFTASVPLILIGNGIGALVVREFTIKSVDQVVRYRYLKNGAMTATGILGLLIILESFGLSVPDAMPTVIMLLTVGIAFWESRKLIKKEKHGAAN
jgi:hypothetical protein